MNPNLIVKQVTDDLSVVLFPSKEHEFLMPTKDVAKGFGISPDTLRTHKFRYQEDLIEGKHFISNVAVRHGASPGSTRTTLWTKRGIIRLGFFIENKRAKLFRDWVEDLVLRSIEQKLPQLPDAPRFKHNRLTVERLLSIMNDVCKIEDMEIRTSIAEKLMGKE